MINLHIKKLRETGVIVLYGFFLPKRLCVFRIIFILMDEYYQSNDYDKIKHCQCHGDEAESIGDCPDFIRERKII